MIRELITPVDNTYVLNLPDEMIGKTIEVIAFEIQNSDKAERSGTPVQTIQDIKKKYARYPVITHEDYKFGRDEANDYE
jgi:hypothetical protein